MGRKKKKARGSFTDFELSIMNALWLLRSGTAHEVRQQMSIGDRLAYTTVSTGLRMLEQKGHVQSFKNGRAHIYAPVSSRDEFTRDQFEKIICETYAGDATAFWSCLLASGLKPDMTAEEILQCLTK